MTADETRVRVAAIGAQSPTSPAFRVRTQIPAAELSRNGVDVVAFPLFSPRVDERFRHGGPTARARALLAARRGLCQRLHEGIDDCQTTFIQRQVDLLPVRGLERAAISGRRLVLDVDDAVWLDAIPEAGGHRMAFLKGTAGKLGWLAARADHVIAGNEHLAEWLLKFNDRLTVIPSLVNVDSVALRSHVPTDHVKLGWIGSGSTARYLARLAPMLGRLARAQPDITWELQAVGGPVPNVPGMICRSVRWSERAEREFLSRTDIGLMPLPDDEWTRGKCAYKALVYMSAGIPVVADDVGITATVVESGGALVGSPEEWTAALAEFARDDELRARLGAEGRRRVAQGFSTDIWAPQLAAILRGG